MANYSKEFNRRVNPIKDIDYTKNTYKEDSIFIPICMSTVMVNSPEIIGISLSTLELTKSIDLGIWRQSTGALGASCGYTIGLSQSNVLKLIDGLYTMLGRLEGGTIEEGKFYPDKKESDDDEDDKNEDA